MTNSRDWKLSMFEWNKNENCMNSTKQITKGELIVDGISSKYRAGVNMRGLNTHYLYQKCIVQIWRNHFTGSTVYHYHEIIFDAKSSNKELDKWRPIILNLWKSPTYNGYITQKGVLLRDEILSKALKLVLGYIRQTQNNFPFIITDGIKQIIWQYHVVTVLN